MITIYYILLLFQYQSIGKYQNHDCRGYPVDVRSTADCHRGPRVARIAEKAL